MHRCKYFYTTITTLSAIITTYMKEPLSEQDRILSEQNLSEQDYLWEALKCLEETVQIKDELAELTAIAQSTVDDGNLKDTLDKLETKAIEKSLEIHNGNITHSAKSLGIGRTNLIAKMKKYGISTDEISQDSSSSKSS